MSVRLKATHTGNVYEILADFFLSLLGVSNPQRRQFDHGYDFYCSLSEESNGLLAFDFPFTIQIKSGNNHEIKYGKQVNKWKPLDIAWLFNHSMPFFIGFVDVKEKSLSIYDTTGVWYLYSKGNINCSQICFKANVREVGEQRKLPEETILKNWQQGKGDGKKYVIDLGNPIIKIGISDLEDSKALQQKKEALKQIIIIERENIINRNLGIFCFKEIKQNTTNKSENVEWGVQFLSNNDQSYVSKIYESINFALISLSINLYAHDRREEVDAIKRVLKFAPKQRHHKQLYDSNNELFDWANGI
jgi:hypothetical protein